MVTEFTVYINHLWHVIQYHIQEVYWYAWFIVTKGYGISTNHNWPVTKATIWETFQFAKMTDGSHLKYFPIHIARHRCFITTLYAASYNSQPGNIFKRKYRLQTYTASSDVPTPSYLSHTTHAWHGCVFPIPWSWDLYTLTYTVTWESWRS